MTSVQVPVAVVPLVPSSLFLMTGVTNNELQGKLLERVVSLLPPDHALLVAAMRKWGLSARAYHRVLRVARSIADLDDQASVNTAHLAEALAYRINEEAAEPSLRVRV